MSLDDSIAATAVIFAEILDGNRPASFVYRDELVSAFMDIAPINPGHVLVVPNAPAKSLAELDPKTGGRMFEVAQRVGAAIRASDIPSDGINLLLADGVAAGQEIAHVHLHVIPRTVDDSVRMQAPDRGPAERPVLDRAAQTIAGQLGESA